MLNLGSHLSFNHFLLDGRRAKLWNQHDDVHYSRITKRVSRNVSL